MTISDLIAQLTRIMGKDSGIEVRMCSKYDSREETFDAFYVLRPGEEQKTVYLVPTAVWTREKAG